MYCAIGPSADRLTQIPEAPSSGIGTRSKTANWLANPAAVY